MCDTLCALPGAVAAGLGATVFAKNSDRPKAEPQPLEQHPPRRERRTSTTYLEVEGAPGETIGVLGSRPAWMWGFEHGLNEAGVAIGNERVWTSADPAGAPPALTGMDLVRLGLERGATARAALDVMVDLLERHGQGGPGYDGDGDPYWSSFLVADPGAAFVLETSGRECAVEEVADRRAISNRLTIPAFDAAHRFDSGGIIEALVDPRLAASDRVLAEAPFDPERAKAHLRSHAGAEGGQTVCMHAEKEATTASMVALLDAERPRGWFLLGSPCRSLYVPLWPERPLGVVPAWERFAALGDEHAEPLLALEAELERDARDDDGWGPEAWARVEAALDELGVPAAAA